MDRRIGAPTVGDRWYTALSSELGGTRLRAGKMVCRSVAYECSSVQMMVESVGFGSGFFTTEV